MLFCTSLNPKNVSPQSEIVFFSENSEQAIYHELVPIRNQTGFSRRDGSIQINRLIRLFQVDRFDVRIFAALEAHEDGGKAVGLGLLRSKRGFEVTAANELISGPIFLINLQHDSGFRLWFFDFSRSDGSFGGNFGHRFDPGHSFGEFFGFGDNLGDQLGDDLGRYLRLRRRCGCRC